LSRIAFIVLHVAAKHKDVLVIGFHEIPLSCYFLHHLRVAVHLFQLSRVPFVSLFVAVNLVIQLVDTLTIFNPVNNSVITDKAYQDYAEDNDKVVFVVSEDTYKSA